jgi:ribonuclease Z
VVAPVLPFEVRVGELDCSEYLELDQLRVSCATAEHHVPCVAYRIDLPRAPRFLPEKARALRVPQNDWRRLQRGETVNGVTPAEVLGPPRRGLAIGLVTDTRPSSAIAELVREVDLLVCEGTFGSEEDQPRAVERKHMTFREAATLAKHAGAKRLLLTHFSPALVDPEEYAQNARDVFEPTIVGRDHLTLSLPFPAET